MNPTRRTAALAVTLASRRGGTTARALAEAAGCSLRAAQETLAALVADELLRVEVPSRRGRERGNWPNVYYTVEVPKR
jgi:predicted ArsR family transcriptional regulator